MIAVASVTRPTDQDISRRLLAEGLGTTLLLAVVIGSGIMGQRLADGNDAVALLGNTVATGAALVVLITIFGPLSGAHFNPAVSIAMLARGQIGAGAATAYVAAQVSGALAGVAIAHLMFDEPMIQLSTHLREGPAQVFSEAVATFGLLMTIFGCLRFRPDATPVMVGLYVIAAYWFTASTSFANPAVTVARALSDTFAGIAPGSVPGFLLGQAVGMITATALGGWLFGKGEPG